MEPPQTGEVVAGIRFRIEQKEPPCWACRPRSGIKPGWASEYPIRAFPLLGGRLHLCASSAIDRFEVLQSQSQQPHWGEDVSALRLPRYIADATLPHISLGQFETI